MIDPVKMTRYGLKDVDLQEVLLFCIAVSGKTATTTARLLDEFLRCLHSTYQGDHFAIIREASRTFDLAKFMGQIGFGCYQMKSRGFIAAAHAGLNLKKCTAEELEQIPGIGHKTSNFFLLHTRRGYQGACLDTHILKFLKELGYDVPKVAPQSQKTYRRVEQYFLAEAAKKQMKVADLDLMVWNYYSGNRDESPFDGKLLVKKRAS